MGADDIIFSMAWANDEGQWRKATYWCDDDTDTGYTEDKFSDGDHEEVEEADLPTSKAVDESWKEYARYVYATGTDPLGEYYVQRKVRTDEAWQFMFKATERGPILVGARLDGVDKDIPTLPKHVTDYLSIEPGRLVARLECFDSNEQFLNQSLLAFDHWQAVLIENEVARTQEEIAADLRRLAEAQATQWGIRDRTRTVGGWVGTIKRRRDKSVKQIHCGPFGTALADSREECEAILAQFAGKFEGDFAVESFLPYIPSK